MSCIDAEVLAGIISGRGDAARADVELHLDVCAECRALFAAFARASDDSGDAGNAALPSEGGLAFAHTVASEPPPATLSEPRVGDLVAGRYMLDRVVGEGGMGIVWGARDLVGGRAVALKMLKNPSPELARRSWREARAATFASHPSLVEVLDVVAPPLSVGDAAPILVMPLLEGESLDRLLAREGTLPAKRAVALLVPVVSGIHAAHAKGVIHRDLKPSNVFLARAPDASNESEPVVLVLDFGLAKLLGGTDEEADKLTRTGAVLGTPHYMAPEQLFGDQAVDHRADVWSIGVILYECLTGRRPLEGKSFAQLVKNAARGAIATLTKTAPEIDPKLAALVDRMLSVERDARPGLGEVHHALRGAC